MSIKDQRLNFKNKVNKLKNNTKEKNNKKISYQFNLSKKDKSQQLYSKDQLSQSSKKLKWHPNFNQLEVN